MFGIVAVVVVVAVAAVVVVVGVGKKSFILVVNLDFSQKR